MKLRTAAAIAIASALLISITIPFTANAQVAPPSRGGTGTSTAPTYGQLLVGNANGGYDLRATSTLGIAGGSGTAGLATTSIDTESELETILTDVLNVFTNNDGALNDDNLSDNSTTELPEGTNLYYTLSRVQTALIGGYSALFGSATATSATTTNLYVSGSFNFLGTIITNVSTWFNGLFDTRLATKSTSNLAEGSNLYFTDTRARDAISENITGIDYSSGLFSLTSGYAIPRTASTTEWATAYSWGNHASAGYLTSESDPVFGISAAAGIDGTDISNWDAAYSWGNHATAGYESTLSFAYPLQRSVNAVSLAFGTTTANTWAAHNIFASLFATNATTTNATTTSFGINSETFRDLTGTGLQNIGGALTLNATGDWTGTLDGQEGSYYLSRANHTGTQLASTISDFSAAASSVLDSISKGYFFSTTSADYWETTQTARTADDLSDNSIEDLSDVAAMTENFGDLLYWNGSTWTDIATSSLGITAGGTPGGSDTQVQYNASNAFAGDAGFTYNAAADRLTVLNASTTALSSSYASSTSGFFGSLSIGALTGLLKGTTGAVSAATAGTDYVAGNTGANTQVSYFTGTGAIAGDAGLTYNAAADRLTSTYASTTAFSSSYASSTLGDIGTLTLNTDLTVANGGTGVSTLTGVVKGNGTSAFTAGVDGTDFTLVNAVSCTNQTMTALTAAGVGTCSSINNAFWSGTDLSVANGGTGLSTFGGTNHILYTTAADTLSSEAAFLYNPSVNRLTVDYASTTAISGANLNLTGSFTTANATTTNLSASQSLYLGSHRLFDYDEYPFSYSSTTQGAGTTTKPSVRVISNPGTAVSATCHFNTFMRVLFTDEAGNRLDDFVASSTEGTITFTTNNTFTANEVMYAYVGTTTNIGSTVYGGCTLRYRNN